MNTHRSNQIPTLPQPSTVPGDDRTREQCQILESVLARVRFLIGEQLPHHELYEILDRIEFLPSLIGSADATDRELFRETIVGLGKWSIFAPAAERAAVLT